MIKPYYESSLGKLYHGDCLEIMPELEQVDLVITDPPYNVGIKYANTNDKLTAEEYVAGILAFRSKIGAADLMVLLGSKTETLLTWWQLFSSAKQIIIRVGASVNTVLGGMRPQYRSLLTTRKSNKWWSDLWEDIRFPGEGYYYNEQRFDHPCHAPLRLMKKCVEGFSSAEELILDPFIGIGTTAVACEYYGRKWIGIEISEKYCEIAAKRIEAEASQLKLW